MLLFCRVCTVMGGTLSAYGLQPPYIVANLSLRCLAEGKRILDAAIVCRSWAAQAPPLPPQDPPGSLHRQGEGSPAGPDLLWPDSCDQNFVPLPRASHLFPSPCSPPQTRCRTPLQNPVQRQRGAEKLRMVQSLQQAMLSRSPQTSRPMASRLRKPTQPLTLRMLGRRASRRPPALRLTTAQLWTPAL